ncbi:hypothetical protein SAMN02910368_01362 [Lachnospiraceae bacterium G11]|nr:hypothetical protein SAMN02910368_01362 [Lachnospiraceae bacterium G11]
MCAKVFEKIANRLIEVLSGLLFAVLAVAAAFVSVVRVDGYAESYCFAWDNPVVNVLFAAAMAAIFMLIAKWVRKDLEKRRKILLIIEMTLAVLGGLAFAAVSKCFPTADQASVYYGAKHFATGWFADLAETGSYFSVYPHQMALALAQETIIRIAHTDSYHVLQGVNALCNALTIWALYSISDTLFDDKNVSIYTLLLTFFALPLFWYTPFVYGDLASIGFSLLGLTLLLKVLLKEDLGKKWHKPALYAGSVLSLFIATLVRSNTLIFVIAVALCLLVYIIRTKKPLLLIYIAVIAILCGTVNKGAIKFYEWRSGNEINDGMPSICHMVMGLQEGPMGNGYYNGYNFDTYVNRANYDQEKAKELAKADFTERIDEFKADPAYTAAFFRDKFFGQWLSTDFDCYHFTCGAYYERWPVVESLFSGTLYKVTSFYMDKYGFFVYALTAFAVISSLIKGFRKSETDEKRGILCYILLTAIIGGAIFSIIWEGAGRYVLPYFVFALPYAGCAIWGLSPNCTSAHQLNRNRRKYEK